MIIKSSIIKSPHGFSTRNGGVSKGIYESLNLGMNRGDNESDVIENWDIFLRDCGIGNNYKKGEIPFVCGAQVHGNVVAIVTKEDMRIAYGNTNLIEADGYVTNVPGVPLAVFTADCTPLIMEDTVNHVVAAVHCGWRSTAADIMKNAVDAMVSLGADVSKIHACIGPAICKDCFEVGIEVVEAMNALLNNDAASGESTEYYLEKEVSGKYLLNLKKVVSLRLMQLGLSESNIDDVNECTMCQPFKYWSHRITGMNRGSQANVIMLKDEDIISSN